MVDHQLSVPLEEPSAHELNVLKLSVLFDHHFLNGRPTQVHFTRNSEMVGTWLDDQGIANLSISLDRIQSMSTEQLAFLIAHEYGHLVLNHPAKTKEIQKHYGITSPYDEFMLPFDGKREYSRLMRDMELEADLFGAQLVLGLGLDPVEGASFLLSQTKSIQHPEGTLRVSKIKAHESILNAEDFSGTSQKLATQFIDTHVFASMGSAEGGLIETPVNAVLAVKAAEEYGVPPAGHQGAGLTGVGVSAVLTLIVLACALPQWWRKISAG